MGSIARLRSMSWLLAVSAVAARPAFATPSDPAVAVAGGSASPEAAEARQRFREASVAAQSGQWQTALKLYRSAYALYPHATTLYNIGYCHAQLGEPTRALYYTTRALEPARFDDDRRLAPEREAAAREFQQVLLERVGSVTISVDSKHPFLLKVDGAPPVATGMEDGSFVPQPDASVASEDRVFVERATLHLDPGSHEVVIESERGSYGRSIEAVAGQAVTIPWSLGAEAEPASSPPAMVAPPPAPAAPPSPSPAARAEPQGPRASALQAESTVYRPLAISSFVVGGAGLGLGLVSGIVALITHDHLEAVCAGSGTCSEDESEAVHRYQTAALLTNIGLWTGLGGGALGVGFLLLDRAGDPPGLSVVVEPSRIGLRGSF